MTNTQRKPLFSSDYRLDILICLGLVLAIFIPYQQVAGHRFVEFDDGLYAFQNTYIIKGLCWDSVVWAFTNVDSTNWHPLTWISHLLDRELYGAHSGGYLLESVAWHALASCLCYLAFLRTTGSRLFGFWVALIFAVHPVNVENVAWLSERKSLLNAAFWFCAIIAYLDFVETRSFRAYGITVIAFILSLMAKPMSVTLPCTLVLIHVLYLVYHPDRRAPGQQVLLCLKRILLPVVPLLALSAYFCAVTMSAQAPAMSDASFTLGLRLINTSLSYVRYLKMFFNPTGLAVFYPMHDEGLTVQAGLLAVAILFSISVAAVLLVRKKPQLLIGWCWYLGTMVPAIGFVQVGAQSHADRYLYLPMLGLAFVFPVLLAELRSLRAWASRLVTGASIAVLGTSMIAATQIQVSYWKDGAALFSHSRAVAGDCATNVLNLAIAYHRMGRFQELFAFADDSMIAAAPIDYKGKLAAIKASGLYYTDQDEAAIVTARQAIRWGGIGVMPYWTLAMANFELGRLDQAVRWLAKARAVQKPINKAHLIDVGNDGVLTGLEKMIKEVTSSTRNPPPRMRRTPWGSGPRIEAW